MITQRLIIGNYLPYIDKTGIRGILRNARGAKSMKGCKNNHGVRSHRVSILSSSGPEINPDKGR